MIAIAAPSPTPPVALAANLFSCCGKLAVEVTSLGDDRAAVVSAERPPIGSFAFLVRNGIKVPALIAWSEGRVLGLSFEAPLADETRQDAFRAAAGRRSRRRASVRAGDLMRTTDIA